MYKHVFAIALGITVSQIDAMTLFKYWEFQNEKEFKQNFEKSNDLIRGFVVLQNGLLKYHRLFGNINFYYNEPGSARRGSSFDKGNDAMSQLLISLFPSVGVEDLNINGTNSLSEIFPNQEELIRITAKLLKISDQARKDGEFNFIDEKTLKSIKEKNKKNIGEIAKFIKERIFSLAYENYIQGLSKFDKKIENRISTHKNIVENLKKAIAESAKRIKSIAEPFEGIKFVENLTVEPLEIDNNYSLPTADIKLAIKNKVDEISTEIINEFSEKLTEGCIQDLFGISSLEASSLTNIVQKLIEKINVLDSIKEYWNMKLRQDIANLLQAIQAQKDEEEEDIQKKKGIEKFFKTTKETLNNKLKKIQRIEQKKVDSMLDRELTIAGTRHAKLAILVKTVVDATRLENKKYPLGYTTNMICAYAWRLVTPKNLLC